MDDVPRTIWTEICRENGWEDSIIRTNRAQGSYGAFDQRKIGAAHCIHPGCGLWIKQDADRCNAGHAQSEDAAHVAASPF